MHRSRKHLEFYYSRVVGEINSPLTGSCFADIESSNKVSVIKFATYLAKWLSHYLYFFSFLFLLDYTRKKCGKVLHVTCHRTDITQIKSHDNYGKVVHRPCSNCISNVQEIHMNSIEFSLSSANKGAVGFILAQELAGKTAKSLFIFLFFFFFFSFITKVEHGNYHMTSHRVTKVWQKSQKWSCHNEVTVTVIGMWQRDHLMNISVTNFIWLYLHQFFNNSNGLKASLKPLRRPFDQY